MNLKTGGILLIVFSLIYLSSDDAYARRIKTNDSKERSIEYGHTFIFDAIKKIRDLDYFKWNQYYRRYEFYVDKEYNHTKK